MKKKMWILIGVLCVLFVLVTVLVKLNLTTSFDSAIYNVLDPRGNDTLINVYKGITFLGSTTFIVSLTVFFFILFIVLKKNMKGYIVAGVLIISTIMNNLVKFIINRPRPAEEIRLVVEKSSSFPSGHTMGAVSMYGILIFLILKSNMKGSYKKALIVILSILPICVAISRVSLGAHFATDVIGGALLALVLLLIDIYIINKKDLLKRKD